MNPSFQFKYITNMKFDKTHSKFTLNHCENACILKFCFYIFWTWIIKNPGKQIWEYFS